MIASCIAPWIPPACRGRVVNTEHLKSNTRNHHSPPTPAGCPKTPATLICNGIYDPLNLGGMSIIQLREICEMVNIPKALATTKVCRTKYYVKHNTFLVFIYDTYCDNDINSHEWSSTWKVYIRMSYKVTVNATFLKQCPVVLEERFLRTAIIRYFVTIKIK